MEKTNNKPQFSKSLFWEFDYDSINWDDFLPIAVQRILERGNEFDLIEMLKYYGFDKVKNTLINLPELSPKAAYFGMALFDLNAPDLKCFTFKQSRIKRLKSFTN